MIKIRMADGITLEITEDISLEDFTKKFEFALESFSTIMIINKEGVKRYINPFQVLYYGDEV